MATYGFCENKCKHELDTVKVSPTEPTTKEKVWIQKGKNLLKLEKTSQTINGVTFTINSDGTISMDGTATTDTNFIFSKQVIKGIGDYTFGITVDFNSIGYGFEVCGYVYGADGQYKYNISTNNSSTRRLEEGEYISDFNISFIGGAQFNNFVIYPQLEQGSTPTEYEPYIEKKIYCKNGNGVYEEFYNESKIDTKLYETTITKSTGSAKLTFLRSGNVVKVKAEITINQNEAVTGLATVTDFPEWAKTSKESNVLTTGTTITGSSEVTDTSESTAIALTCYASFSVTKVDDNTYKVVFSGHNYRGTTTVNLEGIYFV